MILSCDIFFFQAEDGIRDRDVTGVQTCALPIWAIEKQRHKPYLSVEFNVSLGLSIVSVGLLRKGSGKTCLT